MLRGRMRGPLPAEATLVPAGVVRIAFEKSFLRKMRKGNAGPYL